MVLVEIDNELKELLIDYIRRKEHLPQDAEIKIKYVDIDVRRKSWPYLNSDVVNMYRRGDK